jgi:hypothetical protein
LGGWNAWTYETLTNGDGNPAVVTLDGSKTTLQLGGPLADDGQTINAGFFMLVPLASAQGPGLTASLSSGTITLSFSTTTGSNYQVEYKNALTDATWTPLNSPIPGNNSVQSVQYSTTGSQRFYRVEVQ